MVRLWRIVADGSSEYVVTEADAGARLDVLLAQRLSIGRAQTRRLLASGGVWLNGRPTREGDKGRLLAVGDVVRVEIESAGGVGAVLAEPELPLAVLGEGSGWAAVDKPAGVPVHPLYPGERGTLLNAAIARWPEIQGVGEGGLRSGVVHRLDIETSGVILLARTQAAWEKLRSAFENHRTEKLYRAIVAGRVGRDGQKQMDLVIAQHKPARVKVIEAGQRRPAGARRCDLSWRVLEQLRGATLLEVRLGTGFLHQIRVMLAHLGHPVLGDALYGRQQTAAAPRQMLHAWRLRLEGIDVASPDPADFSKVVAALR